MRQLKTSTPSTPRSMSELREWVHARLRLPNGDELELLDAFEAVVARDRATTKESLQKAVRALSGGFTSNVTHFQHELSSRDITIQGISRYFHGILAELTEQAHRDPKTMLLNFNCFMDRLERFLGFEQRLRWCAVGLVDITRFKRYNDTAGHLVGDRIIKQVAQILAEQIRSDDLLGAKGPSPGDRHRDLHARFGGDEFCFFLPDVPGLDEACVIAQRFKTAVARHDWTAEHPALAERPVQVDVGMICLQLGPLVDRQRRAGRLAIALIERADELMYRAKGERSTTVQSTCAKVVGGELFEIVRPPTLHGRPERRFNTKSA